MGGPIEVFYYKDIMEEAKLKQPCVVEVSDPDWSQGSWGWTWRRLRVLSKRTGETPRHQLKIDGIPVLL